LLEFNIATARKLREMEILTSLHLKLFKMAKSEKLSRVRVNAKTTQEGSYKKLLKLMRENLIGFN